MAKTFDIQCFELAEHFLAGEGDAVKDALAIEIQDVIDDFVLELKMRRLQQSEAA